MDTIESLKLEIEALREEIKWLRFDQNSVRIPQEDPLDYQGIQIDTPEGTTNFKVIALEMQQIFEAAPPTVIIKADAPIFTIIYANPAFYQSSGRRAEEVIGMGVLEAFPENPQDKETGNVDAFRTSLAECVRTKKENHLPGQKYDIPIPGTNEFETRYWQASNNPVLHATTGEVTYIIHVSIDITGAFELAEQERIAFELADTQRRELHAVLMEAPAGIVMYDGPEFIFELINPVYQSFFPGRELLGKPILEALPELEGHSVMENFKNTYRTGETYYGKEDKTQLTREVNGPLVDSYWNFIIQARYNENREIDGIVMFGFEVTEQVETRLATQELNEELLSINEELAASNEELLSARQKIEQAESQLRLAIEGANLGSWYIDPETKAVETSSKLTEIYGWDKELPMTLEDAIGQIVGADRERVAKEIEAAVSTGGAYDVSFSMNRFNDGDLIWIRALGKISRMGRERSSVFAGIVMDITEQKRDEQRKNDFIGMVSHELKTPLTSMQAYVQMLLSKAKKADDAFTTNALEQANKQVRKMTTMVNGFLNVSRLEAGKIHIDKRRFDMANLVKEVQEEVILANSSHKFIFNPVLPTIVKADWDKIGHVIHNFISNAVKYAPAQSTIQIACITVGNMVQVSVKDEGKGIHPDDQERLFDRYYRVADTSSQISGFGIGLYLSAEIIHRHDGKIWVESSLDEGSTFYFSLPLLV